MTLKSRDEIMILREGGKLLAEIVHEVAARVAPGVTAQDLDAHAETLMKKAGVKPSFKGFQGYPAATCISINEGLVHGIPYSDVIVKEGDIVSVDAGLKYKGMYTDMAVTVPAGQISRKAKKLVSVTRAALDAAIQQVAPGNTLGDIGYAIQSCAESEGFSVIRSLVGHGVGHAVHEEPRVPNFGKRGEGAVLEEGLVIAIEPMLSAGDYTVATKDDDWTIVMEDGSLSAHFEHTVAVINGGCQVITSLE